MSGIIIRKAEENDILPVTEIYNEVIEEGGYTADLNLVTIKERHEWFEAHQNSIYDILILEDGTGVLGYFYFSPWRKGRKALNKIAELSFFLKKEARGQGLGDLIIEHAVELARKKGLTHLLAILLDTNIRSRKLLEKWGFVIAGELPGIVLMPHDKAGQWILLKHI